MEKFPFPSDGVQKKQDKLYLLGDKEIVLHAQAIAKNVRKWLF